MDADTRHQLKQNELAEALGKIWDFSDRRSLAWLVAIIAIALAYAGYKYWGWRQETRLVAAERMLSAVDPANTDLGNAPLDQLRRLINENSDPGLVARARLLLAQGLEVRGLGADGPANLDQAQREYEAILAMAEAPAVVKAPASYRLGLLYETKRNFAKARETYTALSKNPAFAGSPFTDLANSRLENLDELAEPIEFEPGVRPLSAAESTPEADAEPAGDPLGGEIGATPTLTAEEESAEEPPPSESSEPQQP